MIRLNKTIHLLILILLVKVGLAQNIFDATNSIKFADYLYTSKDFDLASREYERIAFMSPKVDSIEYRLIKSLRLSSQVDKALERVNFVYGDEKEKLSKELASEYLKLLIQNNDFSISRKYIKNNTSLSNLDKDIFKITLELYENNFLQADSLILNSDYKENVFILEYKEVTEQALHLKFKKNWLGVGMSTIIPGTGKIYAGYWKDGLVAFTMFGVAAFQSYRGFKLSGVKSPYGWIFGSISLGFYMGNIYGTNKAINKKNKNYLNRIHDKVEHIFYSVD